jgi:predicted ribosomally synthesized peptide with nif11-like leader
MQRFPSEQFESLSHGLPLRLLRQAPFAQWAPKPQSACSEHATFALHRSLSGSQTSFTGHCPADWQLPPLGTDPSDVPEPPFSSLSLQPQATRHASAHAFPKLSQCLVIWFPPHSKGIIGSREHEREAFVKSTLSAFLTRARDDAAVQERCKLATKQDDPIAALVEVASGLGFDFTREDLEAALRGELAETQLDSVSGGVPGGTAAPDIVGPAGVSFSAPAEWFAELYAKSRSLT